MRGRIVIISPEHESGEKFLGLGGVAGFLRYKVE
jgi:stalled ribosome rescue protein Dom34